MGQFNEKRGFLLPRTLSSVQRRFVTAMLLEKYGGRAFGALGLAVCSNRSSSRIRADWAVQGDGEAPATPAKSGGPP
ncbi:MAG: hypothetical protein HUU55_21675 [Myxococcales bacterium]|nr:hypothetical protein [Myxococcales bacterium]